MSNTTLTIKDPESLIIILAPLVSPNAVAGSIIGGFLGNTGAISRQIDSANQVILRGVFATDGDFARLEHTGDEEDTYVETADGSVCVIAPSRRNEKLVIRLSGCSANIDQLINLKKKKLPFLINMADLSNGFRLTSNCAWMLSNPSRTFGVEDDTQELMFMLTDITDNRESLTNVISSFQQAAANVLNGPTT